MSNMSECTSRILVVDDDEGMRDLIGSVLSEAGLVVATAPKAWCALDMLADNEFDLMVTDIGLPGGLNGLELVRYARARHPTLKSLFISGTADAVLDDLKQDDFVAKTLSPSEVSRLRLGASRSSTSQEAGL
jgi:CheY-like chemotaxis protein